MPTLEWLRKEFSYGYSSGDVTSWFPDKRRRGEEDQIGGSYRRFFRRHVLPRLRKDSRVLELGPGRGSWTRPLLSAVPQGRVHTVDFQDVTPWLRPERWGGRLVCHRATDLSFAGVPDAFFDLFFSVGVLVHNNAGDIEALMSNARGKVKPGGLAIQHYADWRKLDALGWLDKHNIPARFKDEPDEKIWWPRNDQETMRALCQRAGWRVLEIDLGCFARDSVCLLQNPA